VTAVDVTERTAPTAGPTAELVGRRVVLRLVDPSDYPWLRALMGDPAVLVRFRDRGVTVRPEQFVDQLWAGVVAQFVVCRTDGQPLGLVAAFAADHRNRHAHVAVLFDPAATSGAGWRLEAVALFVGYLFDVFGFAKLYGEIVEFNWAAWQSGAGRFFEVEGCLRGHEYHAGRWWDTYVVAVYPEAFAAQRRRLLPTT